jgi:hypothetical protein
VTDRDNVCPQSGVVTVYAIGRNFQPIGTIGTLAGHVLTYPNGITFDSGAEARDYQALKNSEL